MVFPIFRSECQMRATIKVLKLIIDPTTVSEELLNQHISDIMEEEYNFTLEIYHLSTLGLESLTPLMHKRGLNQLIEMSVFAEYDGAVDSAKSTLRRMEEKEVETNKTGEKRKASGPKGVGKKKDVPGQTKISFSK